MQSTSRSRIDERWRAFRRRVNPALQTALAGVAATLLLAFLWPATFRSSAIILIEQQEIPQDLVRSTITSYADQRVQVISQRVMTTANLLDIIRRYKLYPAQLAREPRESLLARMRDDIRMNMISADVIDPRSGRPTQATIAFSVSFDSPSPDLAVKVANELTTLYLNENLSNRSRLTKETAAFLTAESSRLGGEVADLEQRLATFKQHHIGNLPELAQLNLQLVDRTEEELRDTETRIRSLDDQSTYLQAQLVQINPTAQLFTQTGERILSPADRIKALRAQFASLSAVYGADHPDVLRAKRELDGLEREVKAADSSNDLRRRLEQARTELSDARQKYTPDHPDVQRLERSVAGLEESLRTSAKGAGGDASAVAAGIAGDTSAIDAADNPAYIQIRAQLQGAKNERQSLDLKRTELKAKIADFDRKLAQFPEVEREYRALARDYDSAREKFQETRAKQMEAELAQNLETDRKGERFTLIEPPLQPETPVSPNRMAILVVGILLSIGLAVALVAVLEGADSTIRGRHDVVALLASAPLAVIPRIETTAEKLRRGLRWRKAAFGLAGALVCGVIAAHFLYRPLDVLWFSVLRRLGV